MSQRLLSIAVAVVIVLAASSVHAQTPAPPPEYGAPISLEHRPQEVWTKLENGVRFWLAPWDPPADFASKP